MKITWGTGLAIWLVVFVLAILTFVAFAFTQDVNLVHKEYYQKGVDFDNERAMRERAKLEDYRFLIAQNKETINISIEEDYFLGITDVEAYFYRPSDRHKDIRFPFQSSILNVSSKKLIKGKYDLKISWKKNGEDYLLEKYFYLKQP